MKSPSRLLTVRLAAGWLVAAAVSTIALTAGALAKNTNGEGGGGGDGAGNLPATHVAGTGGLSATETLEALQGTFLDPHDDGDLGSESSEGSLSFVVGFDPAEMPANFTGADLLVLAVTAAPFEWSSSPDDRSAIATGLIATLHDPEFAGSGLAVVVVVVDAATGAIEVEAVALSR